MLLKVSSIYICYFCGEKIDTKSFSVDKNQEGFWCDTCDGFNYFQKEDLKKHRFYLLLEDCRIGEKINIKSDVKFKKHISPLRYPGGKSKLIDYVYSQLNLSKTKLFVEPFAGGASVGLSLLNANIIDKLIINDLDYGIYSLFETIKHDPETLLNKINTYQPTHEDYFKAQENITSGYKNLDCFTSAWSLLLVNRLAYSGIYNANPLGGKNGSLEELLKRWNPSTLTKRIGSISKMSNKIIVKNMDACELIEEMYWIDNATLFVDPPYFEKGKYLYNHHYNKSEHIKLNVLLDSLYQGCPGADLILTYDHHEYIKKLYTHPEVKIIKRAYSIAI